MNDFWNGVGTYCIIFENDDAIFDDDTEFYAESALELEELWADFCEENGFDENCIIDVEFVCEDYI